MDSFCTIEGVRVSSMTELLLFFRGEQRGDISAGRAMHYKHRDNIQRPSHYVFTFVGHVKSSGCTESF